MYWQDIYLSKVCTKNELLAAMKHAFGVDETEIEIVADINLYGIELVRKKVICQTYTVIAEKDIRLKLEISLSDNLTPANDIVIFSKILEILGGELLVDNYLPRPDTMLVLHSATVSDDDLEDIIPVQLKEE